MKAHHFNCYDIIDSAGRLYLVQGIHIGAIGQESAIEMMPIDRQTPNIHGKRSMLIVPIQMLEAGIEAGIFTVTEANPSPIE